MDAFDQSPRLPVYFLSHGGGPWPFMGGEFRSQFDWLEASLRDIPQQLPAVPKAVLVISGHWEEDEFTISSGEKPGMVYDYYGFPDYTYQISYPAPGSPQLARRVQELLGKSGWAARLDAERGFDHGTFSMLQPMYPFADMPIVQLSLKSSFDPAEHLRLGAALAPLREEGVLIVGSGFSFHNLRLMGPGGTVPSQAFDGWLRAILLQPDPVVRDNALRQWLKAPAARIAHPREDHLLPLMVVAGAAGNEAASCIYGEKFMHAVYASSFGFGLPGLHNRFDRLAGEAVV
jgi:aromatic ring-opening dioxygenase catalytic subunit (LigB family)